MSDGTILNASKRLKFQRGIGMVKGIACKK